MQSNLEATSRPLLEAIAFASRAHRGQLRKDKETPYASHVFRVCLVLRHVFGFEDARMLTAAVLHDTIEDTTTDFDDVRKEFGEEVAGWVTALTKDKRLPEEERERAYCEQLAAAPWQVRVCKLADVFDNLMDSVHMRPEQRAKSLRNAQRYLKTVGQNLPDEGRRALQMVATLHREIEMGEAGRSDAP